MTNPGTSSPQTASFVSDRLVGVSSGAHELDPAAVHPEITGHLRVETCGQHRALTDRNDFGACLGHRHLAHDLDGFTRALDPRRADEDRVEAARNTEQIDIGLE